ncbi:hypothetical protein QBC34DRAFT_443507 [Podospora aff. communis PSN243]|uniref:Uncharacterized protein n=1 Tax=Podospora aff. communis PSN243 TaxID=3040156 RepID=A0AAV9G5F3_9PEZI|nr:hypothetical protein QBC34DRAFT_443507 [Podospora aff. communis PSN243]
MTLKKPVTIPVLSADEEQQPTPSPPDLSPLDPHPPLPPSLPHRLLTTLTLHLPHLALPLSIILTSAITGSTTYAIANMVIQKRANVSVNPNPTHWLRNARGVYDACYQGCDYKAGCEAGYAWDNCGVTARVGVEGGVECAGARMWNWDDRDKYPEVCLRELGELLKERVLAELRENELRWLGLVVLAVLAGAVVGVLVYKWWKRLVRCAPCERKMEESRAEASGWPGWRESLPGRRYRRRRQAPGAKRGWKGVLVALLGLGKGAVAGRRSLLKSEATVYFSNANNTVSGSVTGRWAYHFLECRVKGGCSWISNPPARYVEEMLPRVAKCGSRVSVKPRGPDFSFPTKRVAHPGIEKQWRVTIKVSGYNVTRSNETDPEVLCLYNLGGALP